MSKYNRDNLHFCSLRVRFACAIYAPPAAPLRLVSLPYVSQKLRTKFKLFFGLNCFVKVDYRGIDVQVEVEVEVKVGCRGIDVEEEVEVEVKSKLAAAWETEGGGGRGEGGGGGAGGGKRGGIGGKKEG